MLKYTGEVEFLTGGIMLRKFLLILTVFMTFSISNSHCFANEDINHDTPICLKVNGEYIKTDVKPFLNNGLTYVPIRFVSNALGADNVTWDESTRTATIKDGSLSIALTPDRNYGMVNNKKVYLDGSIILSRDRTFVPVRFISENMGAEVLWDKSTYTVDINKEGNEVPSDIITTRHYSDDDIYWLSRIVNAESGAEPMRGKIAVANTVLNRVKSKEFPNTIYSVIFDRKYGVQFEPTMNGTIFNTPTGDSIIAAKRALEGESVVAGSMYFLNPRIASNFWIVNNRTFYTTIGNHDFYL